MKLFSAEYWEQMYLGMCNDWTELRSKCDSAIVDLVCLKVAIKKQPGMGLLAAEIQKTIDKLSTNEDTAVSDSRNENEGK